MWRDKDSAQPLASDVAYFCMWYSDMWMWPWRQNTRLVHLKTALTQLQWCRLWCKLPAIKRNIQENRWSSGQPLSRLVLMTIQRLVQLAATDWSRCQQTWLIERGPLVLLDRTTWRTTCSSVFPAPQSRAGVCERTAVRSPSCRVPVNLPGNKAATLLLERGVCPPRASTPIPLCG